MCVCVNGQFRCVLLLPLSRLMGEEFVGVPLTRLDGRATLHAAIVEVYQLSSLEEQAWVRWLVNDPDARVLYVLDGLDEVQPILHRARQLHGRSLPLSLMLQHLLYHDPNHVILTSRPDVEEQLEGTLSLHIDRLQLIGFTDDQIDLYIQRRLRGEEDHIRTITRHLKDNGPVWGACHIPIILQLVCQKLQERLDSPRTPLGFNYDGLFSSLTGLFDSVVRHMKELFQHREQRRLRNLTQAKDSANRVERSLERLAFEATRRRRHDAVLDARLLEWMQEPTSMKRDERGRLDEWVAFGVLQQRRTSPPSDGPEAFFVHLTLQDFFAAKYVARVLAQCQYSLQIRDHPYTLLLPTSSEVEEKSVWDKEKASASSNDDPLTAVLTMLRDRKYELRWEFILVLAVGCLCRSQQERALDNFWWIFHHVKVDVVGSRHACVLISCLNEMIAQTQVGMMDSSSTHLTELISVNLSRAEMQWMLFGCSEAESSWKAGPGNFRMASTLSRAPLVREQLVDRCILHSAILTSGSLDEQKLGWVLALGSSDVRLLDLLGTLLKSTDETVVLRGVQALAKLGYEVGRMPDRLMPLVHTMNEIGLVAARAVHHLGKGQYGQQLITQFMPVLLDDDADVKARIHAVRVLRYVNMDLFPLVLSAMVEIIVCLDKAPLLRATVIQELERHARRKALRGTSFMTWIRHMLLSAKSTDCSALASVALALMSDHPTADDLDWEWFEICLEEDSPQGLLAAQLLPHFMWMLVESNQPLPQPHLDRIIARLVKVCEEAATDVTQIWREWASGQALTLLNSIPTISVPRPATISFVLTALTGFAGKLYDHGEILMKIPIPMSEEDWKQPPTEPPSDAVWLREVLLEPEDADGRWGPLMDHLCAEAVPLICSVNPIHRGQCSITFAGDVTETIYAPMDALRRFVRALPVSHQRSELWMTLNAISRDDSSLSVCSFFIDRGVWRMQPFFRCQKCWNDRVELGCCLSCALHCHEGHPLVAQFSLAYCDCGAGEGDVPCSCVKTRPTCRAESNSHHHSVLSSSTIRSDSSDEEEDEKVDHIQPQQSPPAPSSTVSQRLSSPQLDSPQPAALRRVEGRFPTNLELCSTTAQWIRLTITGPSCSVHELPVPVVEGHMFHPLMFHVNLIMRQVILYAHWDNLDGIAQVLLKHPNLIRYRDTHARSALWWARQLGANRMADLLEEAGADPDAADLWGRRPEDFVDVNRIYRNGNTFHNSLVRSEQMTFQPNLTGTPLINPFNMGSSQIEVPSPERQHHPSTPSASS